MSDCHNNNLYPVLTVLAALTAETVETVVTEETEETVETVECGGAVQAKRPWALHPQDFVYAFLCGQQQQHLLLTQNCEQGGRDHCTG